MSDEARKQLIEARRLITSLARTCRQMKVFLNGNSCLDKKKVTRALDAAIRESDKFCNS